MAFLSTLGPSVAAVEMGKFMKPGKVVQVLAGRYSRYKVVIVKNIDVGTRAYMLWWLELTTVPAK